MNAQRLAQVEEIYHAVLEVAPGGWPSFLASSCGDDVELRREVESLLSFADATHSLIDEPPLDIAAELVAEHQRPKIIGKKIRHYKILSQIGTGGMGDVFLATDTLLERNVAIKFVSAEFAQDADRVRRFMQEAKMASALNHPNILTVHEISKTKKTHFIATEFIDGKTLRKAMSDGELSFDDSLDIAAQVTSALIAAHSAGIFHRDIKPENIMLRSDKLVKVLDFGLAKLQEGDRRKGEEEKMRRGESEKGRNGDGDSPSHLLTLSPSHSLPFSPVPQLTNPGLIMGTFAYMSPEQAVGKATDARSDIWSLGIVMYEMFAGTKPFTGTTSGDLVDAILNNEPEILGDDVPTRLNSIIYKAIRREADDRYQTADELLLDINGIRDLSSVTADHFVASAPGVSSAEYFVHAIKRHRIAAVASIVLLLTVSVSAFFISTARRS